MARTSHRADAGPGRGVLDQIAYRGALPLATAIAAGLSAAGPPLARRVRRRIPGPVGDNLTILGLAGVGWGAVAAIEQLRPVRAAWNSGPTEQRLDWQYTLGSGPPTAALAAAAAALGTPIARRLGRLEHFPRWPSQRPLVVRVGLALLISELVHYWHHHLAHNNETLWPSHASHHSIKRMSWLNANRLHPVDHAPLLALQSLTLLSLGMDVDTLVAYSVFKGVHGQIQHSGIDGVSGPLNWVFSTAEQHRWHHSRRGRDGVTVNYGAVLSTWDRVFGTFYLPADGHPPPAIGLDPVDGYPDTWWRQMLAGLGRGTAGVPHRTRPDRGHGSGGADPTPERRRPDPELQVLDDARV